MTRRKSKQGHQGNTVTAHHDTKTAKDAENVLPVASSPKTQQSQPPLPHRKDSLQPERPAKRRQQQPHHDGAAGSSPAPSYPVLLNLRQMHDVLKLTAAANIEKAAEYLHMVEEVRGLAGDVGNSPGAGGGGSSSNSRPSARTVAVPSQRFVLAAVTRLSALLADADAQRRRDGQPVSDGPGLAAADKIALLAKVVAWYCLETATESAVFSNIGAVGSGIVTHTSQGVSGHATPMVGRGGYRGGGGGGRGLAQDRRGNGRDGDGRATSSASITDSASRFGDWAGSRLSNESFGGLGRQALPDDQLAEQLFRPAMNLAARLSTYYEPRTSSGSSNSNAAATAAVAAPTTTRESDDVRLSTLMLLGAVVARFPDADFHYTTALSVLLPAEDVCKLRPQSNAGGDSLVGNGSHHPLLTPLVWDPNPAVRGAASVVLVLLLYKMQRSLQYAEEPKRKQQSFVSMSTQGGAALMAVHETLYWVLLLAGSRQGHHPGSLKGERASLPDASQLPPAAKDKKIGLLHVYCSAVVVTPYNRCPRCLEVVMSTLELPELRRILRSVDGTAAAAAAPNVEYAAAMSFFSNVFKNESLRTHVSEYFTIPSTPSGDTSSAAATAMARTKGAAEKNKPGASSPNEVSVLSEILSHAKDRIEVWRCIVHISRLYPALIQQHFDELVKVSTSVVEALAVQEEKRARLFNQCKDTAAGKTEKDTTSISKQSSNTRGGGKLGKSISPPPRPPPPAYGEHSSSASGKNAAAAAASSHADPQAKLSAMMETTVSPEAFAECLRAWLHFMGYVWKSFDDNAKDPALRPESQAARATPTQKDVVFKKIILPAAERLGSSEEVKVMTLRCLAQMGDNFFAESAELTPAVRESLIRFVTGAVEDWNERVRAEGLTTMGVWAWQYPSMDVYGPAFVDVAVKSLATGTDTSTRTKAAFALANLTCRLNDETSVTRQSPEHITLLCDTAMQAVADTEPGVQGHGIRILCHLLQTLEFSELIAELDPSSTLMTMYMSNRPLAGRLTLPKVGAPHAPGLFLHPREVQNTEHGSRFSGCGEVGADGGLFNRNNDDPALDTEAHPVLPDATAEASTAAPATAPPPPFDSDHTGALARPFTRDEDTEAVEECVVEGFLRVLLYIMSSTQIDAKRRWNAAFSLGEALSREVVFESEPEAAVDCVQALMTAVVRDRFFKVRTQAALALAKISPHCLAGRYTTNNMSAEVMRALCVALGSSRSTENFMQYKEQGGLVEALRSSLEKVMFSATPSKELDRVFAEYKPLLEQEKLL